MVFVGGLLGTGRRGRERERAAGLGDWVAGPGVGAGGWAWWPGGGAGSGSGLRGVGARASGPGAGSGDGLEATTQVSRLCRGCCYDPLIPPERRKTQVPQRSCLAKAGQQDHLAAILPPAGCRVSLSESLNCIVAEDIPTSFERFGHVLDASWVDQALKETGTASVRRRKIPAALVVWLVIGMALFRDRSIQEVVCHLGLVLPSNKKNSNRPTAGKTVARSTIPQGRYRLGAAPVRAIFERTSETWAAAAADSHRWRGLSLYGLDGTTLRVPDTEENREEFSLPGTSRGQSGYPQVRLVALMALRSHLIAGAAFGPCSGKASGELSLAQKLWPQVPERALVIMDKGLIDYGVFYRLSHDDEGSVTGKKHWLVRAKKNVKYKTLEVLSDGDELVELSLSKQARDKDPGLPMKMVARAIHYQVKGFKPQLLLTSMVDPQQYPAAEVAALYHERWELELGYDEIKTHMLERQEALRSKKAEGVRQEIWGILLAYNLVRKEMLDVAEDQGVDPIRISFRHALQLIRIFCVVESWTSSPGVMPKRLASHREMVASLLILPERRPQRQYKRHVKIKMSGYKRNPGRPADKGSE